MCSFRLSKDSQIIPLKRYIVFSANGDLISKDSPATDGCEMVGGSYSADELGSRLNNRMPQKAGGRRGGSLNAV